MAKPTVTKPLDELVRTYPQCAGEVRALLADSGLTETEIDKHLVLRVGRTIALDGGLPTLDPNHRRAATPMLAERFAFGGALHDLTIHLFSPKEMADLARKKAFRRHYEAQRVQWDGSAPAAFPPDRLSLFAAQSIDDGDVTYLGWPARDGKEPAVWEYWGHNETRHRDVAAYLRLLAR